MTYRERREARAEKLREWADKRDAKATADYDRAHQAVYYKSTSELACLECPKAAE